MVAAKPFPVPQGSQVLLGQTVEILQARGHEVHLIVYGYGVGDAPRGVVMHRAVNPPGARRTRAGLSWAKPLQDIGLLLELRKVARRYPLDVVHAHNYEGLMVALAAGVRPVVYHAHTCMVDELPYFVPKALGPASLGRWLDRSFPRRADGVIALHERMADYLVACGCNRDAVTVIPPPFDESFLLPVSVDSEVPPPVVYAGNLDGYQNLELLDRAMDIVRRERRGAQLHVATSDPRRNVRADRRTVIANSAELRQVLRDDVIVACPRTSWCGYPIKLVNAMAAGKPIVACAGAAHGLRHEESALIVPDDDAGAYAGAIVRLIDDPGLRRRLGEQAQRDAVAQHDGAAIAARIESVYERVVGGSGDRPRGIIGS